MGKMNQLYLDMPHDEIALIRERVSSFAADDRYRSVINQGLCIRAVETTLLDAFSKGKLHGTIHTCVGQELIGAIVGHQLGLDDFVTSNHRGHGHFIGATGNWHGLVDEIVGNADGVCAGIGGSQHLYSANFLSNGQQGGLLPVAAGVALDRKHQGKNGIVASFIGEGTLGEGIVYETMNISSLWNLRHLIICENNFYSQSTPQHLSVAGSISARATAFGWLVREASIWHPAELCSTIAEAFESLRANPRPIFLTVKAYRLNAHSKGDDLRSSDEIAAFSARDPLNIILQTSDRYKTEYQNNLEEVTAYFETARTKDILKRDTYFIEPKRTENARIWTRRASSAFTNQRMTSNLNQFYGNYLSSNENAFFIGEDISDPYGGAFKISRGFESTYPDRVLTTPISEAAIVGVGIGLAITGNRPLIEIMFGDFLMLAFDQLVNNASKFHHMYNRNLLCPLVVRAPMGGGRGYGPTHSQSLERFFVSIDNCFILSLNALIDVETQLAALSSLSLPTIIFENKTDYTLGPLNLPSEFVLETDNSQFPTVAIRPEDADPTVTIVAYGGIARLVADSLLEIFDTTDLIPELITPTAICPLDIGPILASVRLTRRLAVIEEGPAFASVGAEIIAQIVEGGDVPIRVIRISGWTGPIPSVPELENCALPSIQRICTELKALHGD